MNIFEVLTDINNEMPHGYYHYIIHRNRLLFYIDDGVNMVSFSFGNFFYKNGVITNHDKRKCKLLSGNIILKLMSKGVVT
jgi:hypothetical protein